MVTIDEPRLRQFCGHCGKENPPEHRFCGACGAPLMPLESGAPVPSPPPGAPPPAEAVALPIVADPIPPVATQSASPGPPTAVETALPSARTTSAVFPSTPIAPANKPPAVEPEAPVLTGIALERERDRLLTLVNVQRMRGQTGEARKTLEGILALSSSLSGRDLAPTQEMIGDLFAADENWDAALAAFEKAKEMDPSRAGAERKFASLLLRISDIKAEKRLADAILRGDDISNLMATNALATQRGRRNSGFAMALSMLAPGFGQFYNGELIKGSILLGIFMLTLLYGIVSGDLDTLMSKFTSLTTGAAMSPHNHGMISNRVSMYAAHPLSWMSACAAIVLAGDWLYALVDAPFTAAKTPKSEIGPTIDKTGWEV